MHITEGQLTQGSEITGLQHSNGVKEWWQNIFIKQNTPFSEESNWLNSEALVVFVTQYHKGYSISGKEKIIHHYLPHMVGKLYVYFNWLVQPFQKELNVLSHESNTLLVLVWPMNHEGKIWDTLQMTRMMKWDSQWWMRVSFSVWAWWELAIRISHWFLCKNHVFNYNKENEEERFNVDHSEDIHNVQAGHVSWIAENIYSCEIMKMSKVIASMQKHFYQVSQEWHWFLRLDINWFQVKTGQKWKQIDDKQSELQLNALIVCRKWLQQMNIVSKLKEMLRVETEFQGCQQTVIQSIMWEKNCVTQVMNTKERKSLLFMLSAWCSFSEVSIVVVSLIALWADMLVWCQDLQIPCAEWNSQCQEKCNEK